MELKEMIKVMQHYADGGEVEFKQIREDNTKWRLSCPNWNWDNFNYRIKKPKIVIEKWLCKSGENSFYIHEGTDADGIEKVKLLAIYEVEL